ARLAYAWITSAVELASVRRNPHVYPQPWYVPSRIASKNANGSAARVDRSWSAITAYAVVFVSEKKKSVGSSTSRQCAFSTVRYRRSNCHPPSGHCAVASHLVSAAVGATPPARSPRIASARSDTVAPPHPPGGRPARLIDRTRLRPPKPRASFPAASTAITTFAVRPTPVTLPRCTCRAR